MSDFNWRVVRPNTLKVYEQAARDFHEATGLAFDQADEAAARQWDESMKERGLSVNTRRTRLSALAVMSGVTIALPPREKRQTPILSMEQIKALFAQIQKTADRALLMSILLVGEQVQTPAHFLGRGTNCTTQEITRKVKQYARRAGLDETQVNLRTLARSGRVLLTHLSAQDVTRQIGTAVEPVQETLVNWKPLHGIGRRTHTVKA